MYKFNFWSTSKKIAIKIAFITTKKKEIGAKSGKAPQKILQKETICRQGDKVVDIYIVDYNWAFFVLFSQQF